MRNSFTPLVLLALVIIAVVASCTSTPTAVVAPPSVEVGLIECDTPPDRAETPYYVKVGVYKVWMPACACPPTDTTCSQLAKAAKVHIVSFQMQEGFPCREGDIILTSFMPMLEQNRPLLGYYSRPGTIVAWSGGSLEIPALYHELCHMHLAQGDVDHKHPKWRVWDQRGDAIATKITAMHKVVWR